MGSIVSGLLGFTGQRQTNEMQQEDFLASQQFNAQQSQITRDWMTQMSDTAMQRRVADLRAANLNPLLAVGGLQGAPVMGASAASSPGSPNFQNPMSAGINSAAQAASIDAMTAQANLAQAQAKKAISETPTPGHPTVNKQGEIVVEDPDARGHELGDATLANIQANTDTSRAQATQIGAMVNQIQSVIANNDQNTALQKVQTLLAGQNLDILRGTASALISISNADAKYKSLELDAFKNMSVAERNQYLGPVIGTLQSLLGPVAGAIGVARGLGGMGEQKSETSFIGPSGEFRGGSVTTR